METVFGVILVLLGLFVLLKPEVLWNSHRRLYVKNEDARPTQFWRILVRCDGVLIIVVGIVVMLFA